MAAKRAFIILGMHRSGTSSVAGALTLLGAAAPKTLMAAAADNPKGFFESRLVGELNDSILHAAGSSWDDWRRFEPDALQPEAVTAFREQIRTTLQHEFGYDALVVLKDPRLCRIYPIWETVLAEEGYQAEFVLPIRSPLEVARSLNRRNGMPIATGLLLWLRHVLDGEKLTRFKRRRILLWRAFMQDWRTEITSIQQALNWNAEITDAHARDVDGFLSTDLRHEVVADDALNVDPEAHAWAREVYAALAALSAGDDDAVHLATLDRVGSVFEASCQLYGRAYQPLVRRVKELEAECSELVAKAQSASSSGLGATPLEPRQDAGQARVNEARTLTAELLRRASLGSPDVFEWALQRSGTHVQRIRRVRESFVPDNE